MNAFLCWTNAVSYLAYPANVSGMQTQNVYDWPWLFFYVYANATYHLVFAQRSEGFACAGVRGCCMFLSCCWCYITRSEKPHWVCLLVYTFPECLLGVPSRKPHIPNILGSGNDLRLPIRGPPSCAAEHKVNHLGQSTGAKMATGGAMMTKKNDKINNIYIHIYKSAMRLTSTFWIVERVHVEEFEEVTNGQ